MAMENDKTHFSNYTCPKCHGRTCTVSEFSTGNWAGKIPFRLSGNRYRAVTCTLCGYTEFYSLKVMAAQKAEVPAKETASTVIEKAD